MKKRKKSAKKNIEEFVNYYEKQNLNNMEKVNKKTVLDNTDKKLHISDVRERLCLGNFTINKPEEFDLENVKLEIQDYDYDSTTISIDDLRILHKYIGEILNVL